MFNIKRKTKFVFFDKTLYGSGKRLNIKAYLANDYFRAKIMEEHTIYFYLLISAMGLGVTQCVPIGFFFFFKRSGVKRANYFYGSLLIAIGLTCKRDVMDGTVVFHLGPGLPCRYHTVGSDAAFNQFFGYLTQLIPGNGFSFGKRLDSGFCKHIDIVVHDRGRRVERHGHQIVVGIHIIGKYGLEIV